MNATGMVMLYVLAWIGIGAIGLWLSRFVDAVCDSGDEDLARLPGKLLGRSYYLCGIHYSCLSRA